MNRRGDLSRIDDPGLPDLPADGARSADPSQDDVIRLPVAARVVVEAGPGFGKTDVACARVAHLRDQGVEAPRILLLSFTRTAVREMRARIRKLSKSGVEVGGVEVRTLDSFAGRIVAGTSETVPGRWSGHDQTIRKACELLAAPDPDLSDYIRRFEHVFVDEAQDLVGDRARLVALILAALPLTSGYTTFLDPAQAIYDWADECGHGVDGAACFSDLVGELDPKPAHRSLRNLHRTRDPELRQLLLGARHLVLSKPGKETASSLRQVLLQRTGSATTRLDSFHDVLRELGRDADSALLLFRTRAQVLQVSSYLWNAGVSHRLRFGGLPNVTTPWIAVLLNSAYAAHRTTTLDRAALESQWRGLAGTPVAQGWDFDAAWRLLRQLGPGTSKHAIDLRRVADRLASGSPPDDATQKEIGPGGPILGTIHGSKGREASGVALALAEVDEEGDGEERVLYVGLSRAKERLVVRRVDDVLWRRNATGRAWRINRRAGGGNMHAEFGRQGDVDPIASLLAAGDLAANQQALLAKPSGLAPVVNVATSGPPSWTRELRLREASGGPPIGAVSKACVDELGEILKEANPFSHPPTWVGFLRWLDTTTSAIRAEDPRVGRLPEPWRTTRLWLTPIVVGLGLMYPWKGRK